MRPTVEQLRKIMPHAPIAWLVPCTELPERYGITDPGDLAAFFAELAHESSEFTRLTENLNYSAQALANTWARFSVTGVREGLPNELALRVAHNPEAIANVVYAGRYGNGDELSGDGWIYRGRGPIELTFRGNYLAFGVKIGQDLVHFPDHVLIPHVGVEVACAFWRDRVEGRFKADANAKDERRIVNGGTIGLAAAQAYLTRSRAVLAPTVTQA